MILRPIDGTYGQGGGLGLSSVHISSGSLDGAVIGKVLVGEDERAGLKPVNGWGEVVESRAVPRPAATGDVVPGQADSVGVYRRGVAMVSVGVCAVRDAPAKRGKIVRMTEQSKSRMVAALQDLLPSYRFMGTLTVGADWDRDGSAFKALLDRFFVWFLAAMRRASGNPVEDSVFWFLEFQARGAPHVHFFYTTRVPWESAAKKWADLLGCQKLFRTATRFETLRSGKGRSARGGAIAYARKYARKSEQKEVPEDYRSVGRFWGVRGCRIRCTCKVQFPCNRGGLTYVRKITAMCEVAVAAGYLRRLVWQYGDGAVYFVPSELGTVYDIPGPAGYRSLGAALDLVTVRELVE